MTIHGDDIAIHAHRLVKRFGDAVALDGFDLDVPTGSVLSLLGPSGCGKTTALRVIAGFERPDGGNVTISGLEVAGDQVWVAPERRRVGMVFQDYALFPHMTVARNVAYGLHASETHRVADVLGLVGMPDMGSRMPHELSGGEQQRVALARALAPGPEVILLDEPFSNLDAPQRSRMRRELRAILQKARATAVFVTHDQEEALSMADIVAVMDSGRVLQVGRPQDVYRHPVSSWVADFLGESEFIDGEARIGAVDTELGTFPALGAEPGPVTVMIRPEWVQPLPATDGPSTVIHREFYGHDQLVYIQLAEGRVIRSRLGPTPVLNPGDKVEVAIDEVVVFPR
ncbi:MAG: ABC transporter ATP-binding protein [Acidimicrobiia bacterium]|nr:ABC transporter ATP-binding protein [Acidimicrobiia bacterium]